MATVDLLTLSFAAVSSIATCGWVIRNWKLRREDMPKIEMDCRLEKVLSGTTETVIKVTASIKNSGAVRHQFRSLRYDLRGMNASSITHGTLKILNQVNFNIPVRRNQRFFPKSWKYSFVDAGTTSTYTSVIAVPNSIDAFYLDVRMSYSDRESDFHQTTWVGIL